MSGHSSGTLLRRALFSTLYGTESLFVISKIGVCRCNRLPGCSVIRKSERSTTPSDGGPGHRPDEREVCQPYLRPLHRDPLHLGRPYLRLDGVASPQIKTCRRNVAARRVRTRAREMRQAGITMKTVRRKFLRQHRHAERDAAGRQEHQAGFEISIPRYLW